MAKHLWAELKWPEFDELDKASTVVVVPVGSIEQHGPHLPVSCDTNLVTGVATKAAAELTEEGKTRVLVTPTVWAGFSPHHMDFPGAITLSAKLFSDLLFEISSSIYHHGFRRILLINGHGGNATFLKINSARMGEKPDCFVGALSYWDLVKQKLEGVVEDGPKFIPGHGGEFETSLHLVLAPDLVDEEKTSRVEATTEILLAQCSSDVYTYRPIQSVTSTGLLGSSSLGNREKGDHILAMLTDELKKFITDFSRWELPKFSKD